MQTDSGKQHNATKVSEPIAPSAAEPTGSTAQNPRQLFWLKMLVGGLGAAILACMAIIIGRVIYLTTIKTETPAAFTLPADATIADMSVSGDRLILRIKSAGTALQSRSAVPNERIEIWSLSSGRRLQTIAIERQAP